MKTEPMSSRSIVSLVELESTYEFVTCGYLGSIHGPCTVSNYSLRFFFFLILCLSPFDHPALSYIASFCLSLVVSLIEREAAPLIQIEEPIARPPPSEHALTASRNANLWYILLAVHVPGVDTLCSSSPNYSLN